MDNKVISLVFLVLLCFQTVVQSILGRYSRGVLKETYSIPSTIVFNEVLKFIICLVMLKFVHHKENLFFHVIHLIKTSLVASVPGFIYFIQNMLLYIILQNTQAAVYTVIIQLKVFTTAIFSILFLGRTVTLTQWRALTLLVIGVVLVEVSANRYSGKNDSTENNMLGIILSLVMCCCSGFSGVYMEKILKNKTETETEKLNIWERNIQLSVYGASFALLSTFIFDFAKVMKDGYFGGWSYVTLILIVIQGVGGIFVALVMTYADNIVKGFSIGCAIVLTTICSIFIFDAQIDLTFAIGAAFVILSIANYNDKYAKPEA
ncbi:UDP-N-acetylglucosamine transporter, putative [Entamoeba invadens IP1]|uniref:UDP-N-acetylglucosamine transporter, putative n=2 Tax=Entamoeba invadens TaxID=33085 RepID=A0A0A1TWD2_ENTIV|nr:UDP-N-acetylglucosamine transporter, putative [Entamoeba invadens IP1]ELP83621.1 UDP-N-acetylglucosamine transporter, putative [Entamoeba invadens IP1]BAN40607.1 UDP-N-acetylglucosamine transporter, putative [Entamoeba invadens]|eukprot:XP_004182967.1 UDP-N-acetylglucosamine transporter, putative [Entamoeba invadens IP1]